jgi:hypothetical protein
MSEITTHQTDSAAEPNRSEMPPAKLFPKTRKFVRFVSAADAWGRQISILKHRLTFPLLRRVLSKEVERRSTIILWEEISDATLETSIKSHRFVACVMGPICFYSVILITQGLAGVIKNGAYFNQGLMTGIPLVVLTAIRLRSAISYHQRMREELKLRQAKATRTQVAQ